MKQFKVSALVTSEGKWDSASLQHWIPSDILNKIVALPPPDDSANTDRRIWPGNSQGKFTVSSAYSLLCGFPANSVDNCWRTIWKIDAKERVRSFIWLLQHDRLMTNLRKAKMGLSSPTCSFCTEVETALHALRDCQRALDVWIHLVRANCRQVFLTCDLVDWISLNLTQDLGINANLNWQSQWATTCHMLWTWRNKEIHELDYTRPWHP